jgi:hypothetical protein
MTVTFEYTNLTVELAGELLANNTGNRPFKKNAIKKYVADILAGRWHFTAEPVKVDPEGRLLDGQNRCVAVIQASEQKGEPVSIPILLVRGLEANAQDYMDSGTGRSIGDQLARRGAKDYAVAAAASRLCIQYDNGWLSSAEAPTHSQAIEFYDMNAENLQIFVTHARSNNYSAVTPSTLAAGAFLIHRVIGDYEEVMDFISMIKEGVGLGAGDPVLAFRNRLQQARNDKERVDNTTALSMMLRCWNARRAGQTMEKFPIRVRGKAIHAPFIEK